MRFLSVAERELRVTVKRAWFYRARWLTALAFFGLLVWLAWACGLGRNRRAAASLFEAYSIFVFFYCLLVGTASTADCLSRERREGTLGLLFLTNLSSLEIVAGKICSSSLTLLYSLLAIFPLLALPVLFGGITAMDFWSAVLALVNALWFAMAMGFVASALCVRQFPAIAFATGLALFFGAGWVGIMVLLDNLGWRSEITNLLKLFCPLHALIESGQSRGIFARQTFWYSLASAALVSTVSFLGVSWWIARAWRDRPKRAWIGWRSRKESAGPSPGRVAFRRRLLAINPFLWLASRQRVGAPVFMVISCCLIFFTVWVTGPFFGKVLPAGTFRALIGHVFAWLWTGLALHFLTLYYAAAASSQRLAEDRHTGALELVLATSTNERTIARGLWLAYWRRMFYPVLLVTLVHAYFIWQGAFMFTVEPIESLPSGTTAGELLWAAFTSGSIRGQELHWGYGLILRVFLLAWAVFALGWITLGWLGRWLGLSMKRPGFAPLVALGMLVVPPVILFSICVYLVDEFDLDRLPERFLLPMMLWLAFVIFAGHCLALVLWAAAHLRENFRPTVISRDLPETRRAYWRTNGRVVIRLAVGLTGLALLCAAGGYLYVANQNSWSHKRWAAFQKKYAGTLALTNALPPSVPAAENFAAAPAFQSLLRTTAADASALAQAGTVIGAQAGTLTTYNPNDPTVSWIRRAKLSFDGQFKPMGRKVAAATTNGAGATVLARLAPLQPELDAIAKAAVERPKFFPQTRRDRATAFETQSPELRLLVNLHAHFELRACARIETGDFAGAADDAITSLRLTQLAAQSFDLNAALRAQLLAGRSIQPAWEGLSSRGWNEGQIAAIQAELSRLNLLATFTNNVHRTTLAYIELWDQFGHTPARYPLTGATTYRSSDKWQPRGWWLDCAIRLHTLGEEVVANVNVDLGWMRESDDFNGFYELPLDHESQQMLQQPRWWGNNLSLTPFAQTAVNHAILACALERHRLVHGEFPDSLESLVPTFLSRLPTDVLRGRPPGYYKNGNEYTLRGVGQNLRDDRKQAASDDWIWAFGTNAPALK